MFVSSSKKTGTPRIKTSTPINSEEVNNYSCKWFVPADIFLANGEEPNLSLLFFFFIRLFWHFHKYMLKIVNIATFSPQNVTGVDASPDGKI